jgi:hypothetical protein
MFKQSYIEIDNELSVEQTINDTDELKMQSNLKPKEKDDDKNIEGKSKTSSEQQLIIS